MAIVADRVEGLSTRLGSRVIGGRGQGSVAPPSFATERAPFPAALLVLATAAGREAGAAWAGPAATLRACRIPGVANSSVPEGSSHESSSACLGVSSTCDPHENHDDLGSVAFRGWVLRPMSNHQMAWGRCRRSAPSQARDRRPGTQHKELRARVQTFETRFS